jgi:exopolysaccharide transport family protein
MNAYTQLPLTVGREDRSFLFDLPALWSVFRRRFPLFLATAVLTLALVVIVTFQMTPKYDATARVVLDQRETQALDVSAFISGASPDAALVDTEVQLIDSRAMAEQVAERLGLFAVPEFNPEVAAEGEGPLGWLVPGQFDAEAADPRIVRERTIDNVLDAIEVERVGITYAINITARSRDPVRAADLANAFAEAYVDDQLAQQLESYNRTNSFLDAAVEENRNALRVAEDAVERYRNENGLLSAEGALLSEQQVADLQAQLVVQRADLSERQAKLAAVNRRLSLGASADAISDVLSSPVIATLRAKQADLARRRADLETRYGPLHPQIDNLNSEEADLEAQIDAEVDRIVAGLRNEVEIASQRVGALEDSIGNLRVDLSSDNRALVELRELQREAEVSRRNYERLLERSQQIELFEDLAESKARIADAAALPTAPAFPNKLLNVALGIVLGTALGGLAMALAEIFDNGLRTSDDIERTLDTGLLALVPQLDARKLTAETPTPQDYVVAKPLSTFAESYRTVRSALVQGRAGSAAPVIALTSAVSGEGKTASALCLGRIAALSGDRVLIIDCDLRRRVLSASLAGDGEDPRPGLAEVLAGEASFMDAVRKDDETALEILPVSEDRSGTGDMFGGAGFTGLLSGLRQTYDLILLDTAPLTAVADTRAVVAAADKVVQFVKWKQTPATVARTARKILSGLRTPLAGVVLTQVDMRAQSAYGYEGSYRYYGQHKKYYFD